MTNQECVAEILNAFVNDSFAEFPRKIEVELNRAEDDSGGEVKGDVFVLPCATDGEGKVKFDMTEESACLGNFIQAG